MKKLITICFFLLPLFCFSQKLKQKWVLNNPFEQKVFIENNEGQFDGKSADNSSKILFSTCVDGLTLLFTTSGINYRYDEPLHIDEQQRGKMEKEGKEFEVPKPVSHFLSCLWKGANPNVNVIAKDEVSFYYTYPLSTKHTIIAHAFKKLLYTNLYAGIDVEYSFPENKKGIEYTLTIHPGADLSVVKLIYEKAKSIKEDEHGDILIQSEFGEFIDHAPGTTWYKESDEIMSSSFKLNGKEVTFDAGDYDKTKTLIIDPWITNPAIPNYDAGYEVRYDLQGNVYIYGGSASYFALEKINSSGIIQWQFSNGIGGSFGDLAIDKTNGNTYISGILTSNAFVEEINSSGTLIADYNTAAPEYEFWRLAYDNCDDQLIIGGGSTVFAWQGATMPANLATLYPINFFNTSLVTHDIALFAMDEANEYCYMATANSIYHDPPHYRNVLAKCPIPGLYPPSFIVSDGYSFDEVTSVKYVGNSPWYAPNGFNGLAVSPNWLYLYDGARLKRFDKNSGDSAKSVSISSTSFQWAGLDVDNCDNIYVGNNSTIQVYDSTLTLINSFAAPGQIYDLRLSHNNILYACGMGFVATYTVDEPPVSISVTGSPACSGCTGTAYVTLNSCYPQTASYLWSDGQTTEVATGLCGGTYTVTATIDCIPYKDSISIAASPDPSVQIPASSVIQESCIGSDNGSATAVASGGTPPYTYTWLPTGVTTQTLDNVNQGIFSVVVKDANGCSAASTIDMIPKDYELFVANAFSPNGDGQNDKLFVRSNCIKTMDFIIFDRWGNKIFETENENEGWDGNYHGQPMNTGTYVWLLKATMFDKSIIEQKGTVALVR